jgi:putative hydrolase of the HAD superfamily
MTAAGAPAVAAVSFDAMGTLLDLEDPAPRLRASLERRLGLTVSIDRCRAAMTVEMRHYRSINARARDDAALAAVRLECATVLADSLAAGPDGPALLPCLTDAIAYRAYPDAVETVARLAAAGLPIGVVSNWDVSLHGVLRRLALHQEVRAVVTSAEAGAAKPDPAIFRRTAESLGVEPAALLHVGDDPEADVDGARAAGAQAVLLARPGHAPSRRPRIATLLELPALLDLDHA